MKLTLSVALALAGLFLCDPGSAPEAALFATGELSVASHPRDAGVYVDGRFAGQTPITLTAISAGDHRVRIVKNGYLENVRVVRVGVERPASVRATLTPHDAPGSLARQIEAVGTARVWPRSKLPWIAAALAGAGVGGYMATAPPSASGSPSSSTPPSAPPNGRPTAGTIVALPSTGLGASTTIAFSAAGAGDPNGDALTFAWNFGDGVTGTAANPTHVYNTAGTFTVTVTVSDADVSASASGTVTTRVLTGTWRGPIVEGDRTFNTTLVLSQSGATLSGTYADTTPTNGTIAGAVTANAPSITFTVTGAQTQFVFTGNPSATINTLTGVANGTVATIERSGRPGKPEKLTNAPWTLTRQ